MECYDGARTVVFGEAILYLTRDYGDESDGPQTSTLKLVHGEGFLQGGLHILVLTSAVWPRA